VLLRGVVFLGHGVGMLHSYVHRRHCVTSVGDCIVVFKSDLLVLHLLLASGSADTMSILTFPTCERRWPAQLLRGSPLGGVLQEAKVGQQQGSHICSLASVSGNRLELQIIALSDQSWRGGNKRIRLPL
jgi:hypothetical protein